MYFYSIFKTTEGIKCKSNAFKSHEGHSNLVQTTKHAGACSQKPSSLSVLLNSLLAKDHLSIPVISPQGHWEAWEVSQQSIGKVFFSFLFYVILHQCAVLSTLSVHLASAENCSFF